MMMMMMMNSVKQRADAAAGRSRWSPHGTRFNACRHRRPYQVTKCSVLQYV